MKLRLWEGKQCQGYFLILPLDMTIPCKGAVIKYGTEEGGRDLTGSLGSLFDRDLTGAEGI